MAGVALAALLAVQVRDNPWVVVYGLGAIGNIVAQSFHIRGCRVIGVDPIPARRDLAARCGIHHCIGPDQDGALAAVRDITAGRMAGIAVEAVGHTDVVRQALHTTADHGELVLLGTPRVAVEGNITALFNEIHMRMITVRGALEWNLPIYPDVGGRPSQYGKQELIFDWIERGLLKIEPLISQRLAPEHIRDAYEGLLHRPETYTAVVLDWTAAG